MHSGEGDISKKKNLKKTSELIMAKKQKKAVAILFATAFQYSISRIKPDYFFM